MNKLKSLALPAIGTGKLKMPPDVVAAILYDEVNKFSAEKPQTTLKHVIFVAFDKNQIVVNVSVVLGHYGYGNFVPILMLCDCCQLGTF